MSNFITEPYSREIMENAAKSFDCGNDVISSFLRSEEALDNSYGKTYVLLSNDKSEIAGYYNIAMSYIESNTGSKIVKMGGSAHITYFAVDKKYQGHCVKDSKKLSDWLLSDCINRIDYIRTNHIGCSFVTLASTREGYSLYLRSGFELLEDDMSFTKSTEEQMCISMYLPLDYE